MASKKKPENTNSTEDTNEKKGKGAWHKLKKMTGFSPPTSKSTTPEPVVQSSGTTGLECHNEDLTTQGKWAEPVLKSPEYFITTQQNVPQAKVSTSPPSHVYVTEQYRPVGQKSEDYDNLSELQKKLHTSSSPETHAVPLIVEENSPANVVQQQPHYRRKASTEVHVPVPFVQQSPELEHHSKYPRETHHQVHVHQHHQTQPQPNELEVKLTRIELENNRLKDELREKERRLVEYTEMIAQCQTQIKLQQVNYATDFREQTVVDISTQNRMKELEKAIADRERDLLTKDTTLKTMKKDKDEAELRAETLETELAESVKQLNVQAEELKRLSTLQQDLTAAKANKAIAEKRYKETQKLCDDEQTEKQRLQEELSRVKTELEFEKKAAHAQGKKESEKDWKAKIDDLEKIARQMEENYETLQNKCKVLQEKLNKKDEEALDVTTKLLKEQSQNISLNEEIQKLQKENEQTAIGATSRVEEVEKKYLTLLDEKEKQIQDIKEEKAQIATNLEEMTETNAHLVKEITDLKPTEEGASASTNNSLSDQERLQIVLEQLKEKEEEIQDLNGQISQLKDDKLFTQENTTMPNVSDEDPPYNAILAQMEEFAREKQELLAEREKLKREITLHENVIDENKALKEKLYRWKIESQSGSPISTDLQSLSENSKRDSDKNELEHMKEKYKNLECHNTKLKIQLQQKDEEIRKQMNLISELSDKIEKLNNESQLLHLRVTDSKKELQKLMKEVERKEKDLQLNKQEDERKARTIDNHLDQISQKEKEIVQLQNEMSQKEIERQEAVDILNEKQKVITSLQESLRKKADMKEEFEKNWKEAVLQMENDSKVVNSKQRQIEQLAKELELTRAQVATFEEDFKQERKDREKNHGLLTSEITKYQGAAKAMEEALNQATHDKHHYQNQLEALHKQYAAEKKNSSQKLEEEIATLEALKCSLEDKVKDLEEEKQVLTSQVKAYSRQCEDLKRTMVQLQENSKLLEEQLHHKEQIEHEVKAEAQSEKDSKAHLVAAFTQEQQKVEELKRQLKTQTELSKQEYFKVQNANKTLSMKLQESGRQLKEAKDHIAKWMTVLPPEYQRILGQQIQSDVQPSFAPNVPRLNSGRAIPEYQPDEVRVKQRRNYSNIVGPSIPSYDIPAQPTTDGDSSRSDLVLHTSTQVPKQFQSQAAFGPSNPPQYKEQLSGSNDPPQFTAAQMQEYSRQAQRQREQDKQKLEEDRLRLLEEQRRREKLLADQALRELERAEMERANNQSSRNLSQPTSTGYPLSSSESGAQAQDNKVGEMVGGASESIDNTKTSEEIPENLLLQNIDQEIQDYADDVRDMTRRPTTKEVEAENEDTSLAFDPNLVCHKCGKRYHIGEIQKFKRHIKETCPKKK